MSERILEKVEGREAELKNPVVLAYLGDTVYDLFVRTALVKHSKMHVKDLNQCDAADWLKEKFTAQDSEIYRRGRNARVGSVPKNMAVADYHKATGLEAVMGYLFLTGQQERLEQLMGAILEDMGERACE